MGLRLAGLAGEEESTGEAAGDAAAAVETAVSLLSIGRSSWMVAMVDAVGDLVGGLGVPNSWTACSQKVRMGSASVRNPSSRLMTSDPVLL